MFMWIVDHLWVMNVYLVGLYTLIALFIVAFILWEPFRSWIVHGKVQFDYDNFPIVFVPALMIFTWNVILGVILIVISYIWPFLLLASITAGIKFNKEIKSLIAQIKDQIKNRETNE